MNLGSPLNSIFDDELAALFSNQNLSLQGVGSGSIEADVYIVASTGEQPLPTPTALKHPALQFKGQTNGLLLNVFSPLGLCTFTYDDNGTETPITGQLNNSTLTFTTPLPASTNILVGMYVTGNGVDPNATTVQSITRDASNGNVISVELENAPPGEPPQSQYAFSKIPGMFWTSGAMVFGNAGVFAYAGNYSGDEAAIVVELQNQLVCALNRGVANSAPTSGAPGYTTAYWEIEQNWYPPNTVQNLFSLFMHTATVGTEPIFTRPQNPVECARGTLMGMAYGFAYDETAIPVPPVQPNPAPVPSKFDPLPQGAYILTVTLGPWN